jgi:hypothetical protein
MSSHSLNDPSLAWAGETLGLLGELTTLSAASILFLVNSRFDLTASAISVVPVSFLGSPH